MLSTTRSLEELRKIQEKINEIFEENTDYWESNEPNFSIESKTFLPTEYKKPLSDFIENDKEYVTKIELPGVDKDAIRVNIRENGVEISVEKNEESEEKRGDLTWKERSYKGFYRFFTLPENIDNNNLTGKYKDGILELHIPKKNVLEAKKVKIE